MQNKITHIDDLPAEVLAQLKACKLPRNPRLHRLTKEERIYRSCKRCWNASTNDNGLVCGYRSPETARNPRARALRCIYWNDTHIPF